MGLRANKRKALWVEINIFHFFYITFYDIYLFIINIKGSLVENTLQFSVPKTILTTFCSNIWKHQQNIILPMLPPAHSPPPHTIRCTQVAGLGVRCNTMHQPGTNAQKHSLIVPVCCKYTRALTFKNLCLGLIAGGVVAFTSPTINTVCVCMCMCVYVCVCAYSCLSLSLSLSLCV
jgi:hypothetical protein